MNLKKLFRQAYPEESGILLQRFVMGLKTPISKQLLLRGKPDTLQNVTDAAMEIEGVLELHVAAWGKAGRASEGRCCKGATEG